MKRLRDLVASGPLLAMLLPVIVMLALLLRKKMGSPIFILPIRFGSHRELFVMHMLRIPLDEKDDQSIQFPDKWQRTYIRKTIIQWRNSFNWDDIFRHDFRIHSVVVQL